MTKSQHKLAMKEGEMPIPAEIERMLKGEHVLIICKSKWDAHQKARDMFERAGNLAGGSWHVLPVMHLSQTKAMISASHGGGSIEFGWVETCSGRRLDDFAAAQIV